MRPSLPGDTMLRMEPPFESTGDPVADMILQGEAETVHQAEELYLDRNVDEVVRLVESPLSDEELREHPLIVLLFAHGSRDFEDSLR